MLDELNFEDSHLFELFFTDGEIGEEDGLVWKDILKEGTWSYRPGIGQKPVPVPLKIVPGNSSIKGEIGMADLIEAFEEGAIDHVTVPTSHDDKPQDNTGYVKKLKVIERDGKRFLRAGIEFTEPDIAAKAKRKSIANTSAGIIQDYIKKDTGKTYKNVIGHVALTNKPWLNGMQPFSETFSEEEITPLLLDDIVWDSSASMSWIRENISNKLKESNCKVIDISSNRALVTQSVNGGKKSNFVVPFKIKDSEIKIASKDKWVSASAQWVKASMDNEKDFIKNFDSKELLESVSLGADDNTETNEGGKGMGSEQVKSEGKNKQETPSKDPAPAEVTLSEEARKELTESIRSEFSEKYEEAQKEKEKLREQVHEMKVKERVEELKKAGLSEHPGLLVEIRKLMLADRGQTIITLSEKAEGEDEAKEVKLTASGVIERLIGALPEKDGKVILGEQVLINEDHDRPAETPEDFEDKPLDERINTFGEELGLPDFPAKEKETTKQGGDA